ncbi:MAG: DUF2334 domain-containing protein [Lachnospiraceae bacterium]|nr:DUF2334 domain-containing protein [Lachnospiraceae bacterium]
MKIAIRLDDISPDMDRQKFCRLTDLMDRYGVRPLLGIIPDNRDPMIGVMEKDPAFWENMLSLQKRGYVLAMHGAYHVYTTDKGGMFPLNRLSEFSGLSYEEQSGLIRHGKEALRANGIETDIFVAPAHSFDRTTLRVLKEQGFRAVSDGYGTAPFEAAGIIWYPISADRKKALETEEGITTFVIHPATMGEDDFAEYERIFSRQEMLAYGDLIRVLPVRKGPAALFVQRSMALAKRTILEIRNR